MNAGGYRMSGGSLGYTFRHLEDCIDRIEASKNPLHRVFAQHIRLVAKAMHDLEWELSGDYSPGIADKSISIAMGKNCPNDLLEAVKKDLEIAMKQAYEVLQKLKP